MPTPVKPDRFARAAGFDPKEFTHAVQDGASEYQGLPIASWRQDGGAYLNIPEEYADQLGIGQRQSRQSRPNPNEQYPSGNGQQKAITPGWSDAVRDAAPPVSANAGAAYTMGRFADTVARQPQIMDDVADIAALLGSAGLAYATTKEGNAVTAGLTAAGLFGTFKLIRHACSQKAPQTGMQRQRRQQQRPVQQQRQQQQPVQKQEPQQKQLQATDQKRLAHRSAATLDR